MAEKNTKYDLEERTARFGKDVILFCKEIRDNHINRPIISQLIRAATSVGANYCEADDAQSKADFVHKLAICKKEARETIHWFRMITVAEPQLEVKSQSLSGEAKELNLIFNAIIRKTKENLEISN